MSDKRRLTRFTRNDPCNYCDGWDGQRHQPTRCWGGRYSDGTVLCTNGHVDHGDAKWSDSAQAWVHRPEERATVRPVAVPRNPPSRPIQEPKSADHWQPDRTYDYRDDGGQFVRQFCRWGNGEHKKTLWRRPNPDRPGHWLSGAGDAPDVLYRLPELLAADPEVTVFVCAGEKDTDRLRAAGLVATTNPNGEGPGKWLSEFTPYLAGRHVVILEDNDETGRAHCQEVAAALQGIATSVKVVRLPGLPEHGDVSDWLDAGHTIDDLLQLVEVWPEWRPPSGNFPDDPIIAEARAAIERDLAEAEREITRLRKLCAHKDELITSIERLLESKTTKQEVKAPFASLLIARYHNPRFADADDRPVPLWQEQFSEMMGGADPKTVRTWIQTIGAENLATVIKEPTGRTITLPGGGKVEQERYAIQLGADPDRAPVSLATWRELMCNPKADAKRKPRKQYERRCPDHPDADLRRDYHCTTCERLVYQDTVAPQAAEQPLPLERLSRANSAAGGKFSPSKPFVGGKLSPSEVVAMPPSAPPQEPVYRESFPITTTCRCGDLLTKGQDCPHCNDRACLECGELTGSGLRKFCVPYCHSTPAAYASATGAIC